ncbi:hypothetical protein [Mycobacterium sp.]|uniref:hypothetical protein n=1 Tax=Mycobacterium sp. TaxID=1785 RepID=UPI003C5A8B95
MAHVDAVIFGEVTKRLISAFLVEYALACITNITTTVCGSEIGFLLASTNSREDLGTLRSGWLVGLDNLFYFLVVAICNIGQLASKIMDASKCGRI